MKITDLTHLPLDLFKAFKTPEIYDFTTSEELLGFLKTEDLHPPLLLNLNNYKMTCYSRSRYETNVLCSLHPRLFLTCLRAAEGRADTL